MDPTTALEILGGARLGKEVVGKMLGPTADYIGEGIRDWTVRRTHNIQRFSSAHTAGCRRASWIGQLPCRLAS